MFAARLALQRVAAHSLPRVTAAAAAPSSSSSAAVMGGAWRALATKGASAASSAASSSTKPAPAEIDMTARTCPDDEVPSILDQGTGLERAEIEYPDLFKHNEVIRGDFGTEEKPVLIQSIYDERIVGCTGRAAPDDHDITWILVEKGQLATCPDCDQKFKLVPPS